nr:protein kinase-like domain, phloem protein 2-like protein [Tanacetum cinerariifolium]
GEVICERIYIEACLNLNQYDRLQDPSEFENLRFPGGRCYCKHKEKLNVRVRARFLYPLITYSVNIVFRNVGINMLKTVYFKLNGEKKCCIVYDTYEREDGWFVVPLYQFTSDLKIAHFEISIDIFGSGYCKLQVAGFEFQPLEEKVELHDQGLEEYQDIAKAASQPLFYKSLEEFKVLLTKGFHINNYKMWFSLNENGEHCVMLSISHCLIASEGGVSSNNYSDVYSRFPSFHCIEDKRFRVHIRCQYLTPSIIYTVNLVLNKGDQPLKKKKYVALRYKLEGERETSIVYLANETKDKRSFIAELYQFTSDGSVFDLKIVFKGHKAGLKVEGILFQPLEKVEHEQVLKDEKLSNDSLQWTMKEKDLGKKLLKWFYRDKEGQEVHPI